MYCRKAVLVPCKQASGGADHFGISETKVMPILVGRRVGAQSTAKACEAVLAHECLRPGQTRCRSPGFAVPRAFRSEAHERIDHLVGSLGHPEFKTREDSTAGPPRARNTKLSEQSTRLDAHRVGSH